MSCSKCVAVALLLASAVVQASQCSRNGECPSDGEPQNAVSLLQTKLQANFIGDSVEVVKKPAQVEVEEARARASSPSSGQKSGSKDEEIDAGIVMPQLKMEFPTYTSLNFIHIPKCAGTTIEDVGLQNNMSWGRFDSCSGRTWKETTSMGECCPTWHSPRFLQANCPNLAKDSFCVTRDPYDRLVSQYQYDQHWKEASDCSIAGLNRYIKQGLGDYQNGNYCVWRCHARPQSEFIWQPDGSRFCQNVLRLDDEFPDAFSNLMASHMSPMHLGAPHNEADVCDNLTADNFTAETRSLIESVYAADFSKLNYSLWSSRIQ